MDWDHMINNKARSGSFAGSSAEDEDAYYGAFAGSEKPVRLSWMFATARLAVALVGAAAFNVIQTR